MLRKRKGEETHNVGDTADFAHITDELLAWLVGLLLEEGFHVSSLLEVLLQDLLLLGCVASCWRRTSRPPDTGLLRF